MLKGIQGYGGWHRTFMSKRSQTFSCPGDAKYSSKSWNLGIGSCGAASVRCWLMYSHVQFTIFSSLPKHRLSVASCQICFSQSFSGRSNVQYSHETKLPRRPWSSVYPSPWRGPLH